MQRGESFHGGGPCLRACADDGAGDAVAELEDAARRELGPHVEARVGRGVRNDLLANAPRDVCLLALFGGSELRGTSRCLRCAVAGGATRAGASLSVPCRIPPRTAGKCAATTADGKG